MAAAANRSESTSSETAFSACCSQHAWSETSQAPGPRPLLVSTAANMVRDLTSTLSETAFSAYCSQHGPRPLKYPVRDRLYCPLQPTWSVTSQVPGPDRFSGPTAANMVRDPSSTRSETAFSAYCSQHPRPPKHPDRDRFYCLLQPTWFETSQVPGPRPLLVPTAANMVRDLLSTGPRPL